MKKKTIVCWLAACLLPAVFFYLMECYTHKPWVDVGGFAQFANIALFELFAAVLLFLTGSVRCALRIEAVAAMLFGIANTYVMRFRGNPLVPWDFYSIKTAASVADNYSFAPGKRIVAVTFVFLVLLVLIHWLPISVGKGLLKTKKILPFFLQRILPAAAAVCLLVGFSSLLGQESFQNRHKLYNKLFTPGYMTNVNGVTVTFVMNLAYLSVEKPADYNKEETARLLASYEEETETPEEYPNIIAVMDEAFSDLAVLGDFETNRDYMPFLHSLQQNPGEVVKGSTVTGKLNVSVCGGNTANTEFEFLTGNTMAFLPQGSVPYQQYIHDETPSLASHLQSLGYKTVAMHPYRASGWEREEVYPLLGFSEAYFKNDFHTTKIVRKFISDDACVDKIEQIYESKGDEPLFLFNVTMQNHGNYREEYPDFAQDLKVEGVDSFPVEQYFSLLELTDQALERLIRYFENQDEKTIIVFFGDHQPNDSVAGPIMRYSGTAEGKTEEEVTRLRYQVPYLIWANYELTSEQNVDTSANYLAAEMLEWAGLPTSPYQNFLLSQKEEYPIFSTMRLLDRTGQEQNINDPDVDVETYRKAQYYQLFDYEVEKDEGKNKK